jgi:hypothetical protein
MELRKLAFTVIFSVFLISVLFFSNKVYVKGSCLEPLVFKLLAVEQMFDSNRMISAQALISRLLDFPNWNNSTDEFISYIHLLSCYNYSEVSDELKPFWKNILTTKTLKYEIINFLGNSSPGDIVIFYYNGHSYVRSMPPPPYSELMGVISEEELRAWVNQTLSSAWLTLILDTCY